MWQYFYMYAQIPELQVTPTSMFQNPLYHVHPILNSGTCPVENKKVIISQSVTQFLRNTTPPSQRRENQISGNLTPDQITFRETIVKKIYQLRSKLEELKTKVKSNAFLHVLPFAPSVSASSFDHDYKCTASESTRNPIQSQRNSMSSVAPNSTGAGSSQQSTDFLTVISTTFEIHSKHNYCKQQEIPKSSEELSVDEEFKDKCRKYEQAQKETTEEFEQIEQSTRGQSVNENWHKHRQEKVTASVAGAIINRRKTTPPDNLPRIKGYDNRKFILKA
ncbi:uncharacterized protein LOC110990489 isoform X2 [Acanthaster planci]|uniref:Uncharacterized protein LOC110990489 isoform X1 n=1 Tax=Acanthaster planci TaxID=133434 RepID=A0A8B8A1I5_ACAPL|nr:uncharacterized protein LOC110990489 isoform X1 [Acanthaster planci]XP_022111217.1 uncharacterized protein LOC110990489 isoform X2 [Acanthaster planci]